MPMDRLDMKILERAGQIGFTEGLAFAHELLIPEQRIRDFCQENKCGHYLGNYMCPPYIGSIVEMKERLGEFHRGVLLQYSKSLEVKRGNKEVRESRVALHNKILEIEEFMRNEGIERMWGISGGSCALCDVCQAKLGEPCVYPDKAKTSLEALGVNVLALLHKLGLDNKFYPDKITWTGCILFEHSPPGNDEEACISAFGHIPVAAG